MDRGANKYTGSFRGWRKDGFGTLIEGGVGGGGGGESGDGEGVGAAVGERYVGNWSNGLRNGYGTIYRRDGYRFAGLFDNGAFYFCSHSFVCRFSFVFLFVRLFACRSLFVVYCRRSSVSLAFVCCRRRRRPPKPPRPLNRPDPQFDKKDRPTDQGRIYGPEEDEPEEPPSSTSASSSSSSSPADEEEETVVRSSPVVASSFSELSSSSPSPPAPPLRTRPRSRGRAAGRMIASAAAEMMRRGTGDARRGGSR